MTARELNPVAVVQGLSFFFVLFVKEKTVGECGVRYSLLSSFMC